MRLCCRTVQKFREHVGAELPRAFTAALCFDKIDAERGIEGVHGPDGDTRTLRHPWSVLASSSRGRDGLRALRAGELDEERETPPAEPLLAALLAIPRRRGPEHADPGGRGAHVRPLPGADLGRLRAAADEVKQSLREYAGVYEVTDTFRADKEEMRLGIKPAAEALGLTLQDLGREVRQAFYGEEAQRIQRGRDDIRVMVRYPRDERRSLGDLENMRIRTPDGGEVPFGQVAVVEPGRGFASIRRVDRNRAVNVTASVDATVTSAGDVIADLNARILPEALARHPGVFYTFEGMMAEQRDVLGGLQRGFVLALLLTFALLAVPLRSYVQPLIIMSAIPFGFIGAVWGHLFLGLDVSMMSMFGLVAVTGVVVNDSLIMVDFINRGRAVHTGVGRMAQQAGGGPADRRGFESDGLALAVREAGVQRFRPILPTSLTTLTPHSWCR